ncbi:hypothetical protein CGC47_02120 [Capnocytophaga canimorsus]|nr:hypothetical protein CGC47_02120 [Capnocytophaga canimorsus]
MAKKKILPLLVQKINSKAVPFKTIKRDVCKLITLLMKTDYLSIYSSNVFFNSSKKAALDLALVFIRWKA